MSLGNHPDEVVRPDEARLTMDCVLTRKVGQVPFAGCMKSTRRCSSFSFFGGKGAGWWRKGVPPLDCFHSIDLGLNDPS